MSTDYQLLYENAREVMENDSKEINRLEQEVARLEAVNKNMHTCVSGYLKGKQWEHWQQFNEPKFIFK